LPPRWSSAPRRWPTSTAPSACVSGASLSPTIFVDLVRQPLWLASIVGTVLGIALQVLALRFGPLALVEPLLVCDLIFAMLLASYLRHFYDPVLPGGILASAAGWLASWLSRGRPAAAQASASWLSCPLAAGLAAAVGSFLVPHARTTWCAELVLTPNR
jgi:hypothetical protein